MNISPAFCWFLVGVLFFVVELALPGFIIFFFGIGAWATALAAYFLEISVKVQLLVFLAVSLLTLLLLRKLLNTIFTGGRAEQNGTVDEATIGGTAVVAEPIVPPAEGRVKYGGSFWRAVSDEKIDGGTVVEITAQEGLILRVRPM